MNDLTAFQRDVLWTVAELGDPKGLAIKAELENYYGNEVNHGRLYPNLDTLVEKELIIKSEKDKRTNGYRLSESGRRGLQSRYAWETEKIEGDS